MLKEGKVVIGAVLKLRSRYRGQRKRFAFDE
jgi:hypothetical protein